MEFHRVSYELLLHNITSVVANEDREVAQNNIATDYRYRLRLKQVEEGGELNIEMLQCNITSDVTIRGTSWL